MKLRGKILLLGVTVLVAAVLVPMFYHYQLKAAVNSFRAELKAKGEPMELAEVIPARVPPDKNSAAQFLAATSLFATNESVLTTNWPIGMRSVAPGKAQVLWQQNFIRDFGMSNSWEDLALALEANKEAFNRLAAITNSSVFDFGLKYEQRFEMLITNLVVEKKTAEKLTAKTFNDLRLKQAGPAAENIRVMLSLVEGTRDERTAISQLVRIAIAQIACAATWEFLQSSNLTDSQLAGLQADWSRPEFLQAMAAVLPVERECSQTAAVNWRKSSAEMLRYFDLSRKAREALGNDIEEETAFEQIKKRGQIFLWRYWWSYPDELRSLKGYQVLMDTMKQASSDQSFRAALAKQDVALEALSISKLSNSFDSFLTGKTDFHNMFSESIVTLAGLPRKVLRAETDRQTVIAAIALKRFQLKHGSYPPSLTTLVPEFVSTVPLDPVDSQPLRYRQQSGGTFLLYSIGENGKDDGGNPSPENEAEHANFNWLNPRALDWVWPQPATDKEVDAYFTEQAKTYN